ncbi:toll/interleukin-1 receptor domain-containing protein [Catellatospora bangladeshensis]|uniref:TIR domain-containing protein n=1 Tax=Catellatospora bangladeshensis TaxID=310355 RepID=A0A8J3JTU6_9ACTN|nr:toll/interleukin-1 receptor domain-containing protein [Catellatospora bangladeshensis]GIF85050.1 hypothetical protein Cba03nite_63990 [Catellatospora bangladeshensis]
MTNSAAETNVVRCFLSYSRDDNTAMRGIADQLKASLTGLYRAKTGRELEIFVDRDNIGWGEDWRNKIASSIRQATVFIPLVTMNYFNRPACRDELIAFYESARIVGVTDLVLPIVLAGSRTLADQNARDEVKIVESLNYKNFERIWIRGYDSPEWLTAVDDLVESLIKAIEAAEQTLVAMEVGSVAAASDLGVSPPSVDVDQVPLEDGGAELGLFDVLESLNDAGSALPLATERALEDLRVFAEVVGESFSDHVGNGADLQKAGPMIAARVTAPAATVGESGVAFGRLISRIDAELRFFVGELNSFDVPELHATFEVQLNRIRESLEGGDAAVETIRQVRTYIKLAQSMSLSLRKSLAPALLGITAIENALNTTLTWKNIRAGQAG